MKTSLNCCSLFNWFLTLHVTSNGSFAPGSLIIKILLLWLTNVNTQDCLPCPQLDRWTDQLQIDCTRRKVSLPKSHDRGLDCIKSVALEFMLDKVDSRGHPFSWTRRMLLHMPPACINGCAGLVARCKAPFRVTLRKISMFKMIALMWESLGQVNGTTYQENGESYMGKKKWSK